MRRIGVLVGLACHAPSETPDSGVDGPANVGATGCPNTFAAPDVVIDSVTIGDPLAVEALQDIRAISGNLDIAFADVTLPNLAYVGGDVTIRSGTVALPSLCYVAKSLAVNSSALTALSLPSLAGVAGDVGIVAPLSTLDAPRLTTIGGSLSLGFHGDDPIPLTSLTGLSALTTVESVSIAGAANLVDLTGLENVQTLPLGLIVRDCPNLRSLDGLALAPGPIGKVTLSNLPLLLHVSELAPITSTTGLEIEDCLRLIDVDLGALTTAGSIGLDTDRALTALAFPALTTATGLFITGNDVLAAIDAPNLTSITRTFMISGNDLLANIAFPALTAIAGNAYVIDNPVLPTRQQERVSQIPAGVQ